jgi:fructokinase
MGGRSGGPVGGGEDVRIGVDLGGTKIEALALGDDGNELARARVATPRGDYERSLAAVRDLVLRLEQETGAPGTVGVGGPGAISPVMKP